MLICLRMKFFSDMGKKLMSMMPINVLIAILPLGLKIYELNTMPYNNRFERDAA